MKYKYLCNKSLLRFSSKPDLEPASAGAGGRGETRGLTLQQGPGLGTLHCGITWPQVKWETRSRGPDQRSQMCTWFCPPALGWSRPVSDNDHARQLRISLKSRFNLVFVSLFCFRGRNVFCNFQSLHGRATNQTQGCSLLIIGNLCRDHGPSGQPVTLYWIIT